MDRLLVGIPDARTHVEEPTRDGYPLQGSWAASFYTTRPGLLIARITNTTKLPPRLNAGPVTAAVQLYAPRTTAQTICNIPGVAYTPKTSCVIHAGPVTAAVFTHARLGTAFQTYRYISMVTDAPRSTSIIHAGPVTAAVRQTATTRYASQSNRLVTKIAPTPR
jgi:hypothetical protein